MKNLYALSLWQPWAALCAYPNADGIAPKSYETRSWSTRYRGPLVIHATARFSPDEQAMAICEPFKAALAEIGFESPLTLPRKAALGIVDLINIYPTEAIRPKLSENERAFGDYGPGRFAWELSNPRPFPEPIPIRGAQRLWRWPGEIPLPECQRRLIP